MQSVYACNATLANLQLNYGHEYFQDIHETYKFDTETYRDVELSRPSRDRALQLKSPRPKPKRTQKRDETETFETETKKLKAKS